MAKDVVPDSKAPENPGPEPETLKIDGNWEDSLKEALEVELPKQNK